MKQNVITTFDAGYDVPSIRISCGGCSNVYEYHNGAHIFRICSECGNKLREKDDEI